ncbi:MAG: WD40 repeat domain-containing protein, partial [Chloroflexota bacterium]
MAHPDKAQIINLVNDLVSRSSLTIDQIVGRMQARGCDISRGSFENQFTTRLERKPNLPPDWTLALVAVFTERLTDQERCTAAEALELARLTHLPLDQLKTLAHFFPPAEFDAAYCPYDPRSNRRPARPPPETTLHRPANQSAPLGDGLPEKISDTVGDVSTAGATAGKRETGTAPLPPQRGEFRLFAKRPPLGGPAVRLGLLAGVLLVLGLAWLALDQRQQLAAEHQATLSRQLAAQALDLLPAQLDLALLLSAAAYQTADTFEARDSLLTVLQTSPHLETYLRGHRDWVWDVAFSPDGRTLASGSADGKIIFWDTATRRPLILPLTHPGSRVRTAAFSPNGNILASGSAGGAIMLWDVSALIGRTDSTGLNNAKATPQPLSQPLTGHAGFITAVAFSPDGRTLASSSADGTVRLWDVSTAQEIGPPLTGHTGWVLDLAFSPDGHTLASAGTDQTIILWDVANEDDTDRPLAYALTGHQGAVLSVAFSPDGQTLASGSTDGTIRLWDVAGRRPRGQPLTGHRGEVNRVVFSPDGQTLASAGEDKTVILWAAGRGQPLDQPLVGHTGTILGLAFSPNGQTLASGSV